jgi:HPt (histidine-containing phosphotransfer) domain-containing protein
VWAAASCDDGNTIYRCAHSFAGAARNVGADALAERAAALEATVGSLSAARIAVELAAMQAELGGLAGCVGIGDQAVFTQIEKVLQPDVDPFLGERAAPEGCPDEVHRITQADPQQTFLQQPPAG